MGKSLVVLLVFTVIRADAVIYWAIARNVRCLVMWRAVLDIKELSHILPD